MTTSHKNLALKIVKIMKEGCYIPKNGINSFHKYKYAKESDIVEMFQSKLAEHNICMTTSVVERTSEMYKDSFLVTVKLEVTFIDAESGEELVIMGYGDGIDKGDKGIYKAITGAHKYLLLKNFLVSTGDDPENSHHLDRELQDLARTHPEKSRKKYASLSPSQKSKVNVVKLAAITSAPPNALLSPIIPPSAINNPTGMMMADNMWEK